MFALGLHSYITDNINLFDCTLVMLSIVEFVKGNTRSSYNSLKTLRILRVLRVARLLRSLQYMHVIIKVLATTLSSAIYIALLLCLIIFVYSLLGI